ncbi:MAG: tRNA 2-thiouridine(34) synthase MnmA [Clostridia bacterium]|nr:tRNA 2-thiouridine(34) synthase MnmA [Clostridia bacterium]
MSEKVLVAMSGGVDSSVAAARLVEDGYTCVGATMRLFDKGSTCGSAVEAGDAARVAQQLGFAHHVFDCTDTFSTQVIDRFVAAYERGLTPNPCIECNRYMKFAALYDEARALGCDAIATGHYARVEYDERQGRWTLKKARNLAKDQTYVLYFLTQEQLAHTRFPLGDAETKDEVRAIAERYGFENAHKKDSQDICFVPDGKYADFIRARTGRDYAVGDFVDGEGKVLGQHKGIIGYTIGQRKGLGLALPAPMYVCRKDMQNNTVVLAPEAALYSRRLWATDFNWTSGVTPQKPIRAMAKTRYSAKEAPATVSVCDDGRVQVLFDTPQRAVTEGQAVVLYSSDEVLGGGTIVQKEELV